MKGTETKDGALMGAERTMARSIGPMKVEEITILELAQGWAILRSGRVYREATAAGALKRVKSWAKRRATKGTSTIQLVTWSVSTELARMIVRSLGD